MKIKYSRAALRYLAKLESKQAARIRFAIEGLTKAPPEGDIKPLSGYSDGRMRLRVGGWRVIYRYDETGGLMILLVIDIGSRGDIYK